MDNPTSRKNLFSSPDWVTLVCDNRGATETLAVRHSSGALAVLCDEPGVLAKYASQSEAKYPVMMLQPHIARKRETKQIVYDSAATPQLFIAWLRVDMTLSTYRQGPGAAPRYGPHDATEGESLPHIVGALLDVKNNPVYGGSCGVSVDDDSETEEEPEEQEVEEGVVRRRRAKPNPRTAMSSLKHNTAPGSKCKKCKFGKNCTKKRCAFDHDCDFYRRGGCNKSEADCKFRHVK
jgi:hypothetical protein